MYKCQKFRKSPFLQPILQGMFLNVILDGILERARDVKIGENELLILQSVLLKILMYFGDIEKILALVCF